MRVPEITESQQRLLRELTRRISNRLEAEFAAPGTGQSTVTVKLQERSRSAVIELPIALLLQSSDDAVAREAVRVRLKAGRDRMLFRAPPARLPKRIEGATDPGTARFGDRRGRR